MNIDDLKDAWNNDEPGNMRLPISAAALGKTSSAIVKVRKNMKAEFIATLISYVVLFLFLFAHPHNALFFNISCILLFTLTILNAYYFSRFYIFYKSIGRYDLNMKDSVTRLAYELELNTELYKAYNFCIAPLAVLLTAGLIGSRQTADFVQSELTANSIISPGMLLTVCAIIVISFLLTYAGINFHVRLQYGKYLKELKQVMADLGRED
jgi:hypothetical protein